MARPIEEIMDKLCDILRDRMPGVQVRWIRHHHTVDAEVEISKSIEGKLFTMRESFDELLLRTTKDEANFLAAQATRIVARTVNGLGNAMIEEKEQSALHYKPRHFDTGGFDEVDPAEYLPEFDQEEVKPIKDLAVSTNPVANTW